MAGGAVKKLLKLNDLVNQRIEDVRMDYHSGALVLEFQGNQTLEIRPKSRDEIEVLLNDERTEL
jgi:hypothetical protein